jgi:signal transduction histidine kinase/CheY-like chemotaxis protein
MKPGLLTVELASEQDVVLARQRARQVARLLGFDGQDQTRISTAVSEIARNAFRYAHNGKVALSLHGNGSAALLVTISDEGPGIPDLAAVLDGRHHSTTGMGMGILGARRLMDSFTITSTPAGTRVVMSKHFSKSLPAPAAGRLNEIANELARQRPSDPLDEIQQQNQELLHVLEDLRKERERLAQVNRELEETNRGVVALYAELDERAGYLQRANEVRTKFLSNMTHEFRTPLNSITSLTRILLQRLDGDLSVEQEKQVRFIQRAADALSELVNDLLDLAKVEAGKVVVRPSDFKVTDQFGTLRGMLRPLLAQNGAVDLTFDEPHGLPTLHTDESKVSQILRNFISNALKYTERGEVRVSARMGTGDTVIFEVTDTGIGIAEEDQETIFEEYSQVDNPLQTRVKGTGLGLPLARKLAGLLGGSIGVRSRLGSGSTFFAVLPVRFEGKTVLSFVPEVSRVIDPTRLPVLVVEDNPESLFIYDKYLKGTGYQVLPARTLKEAQEWLRTVRPVAMVLDILLESENTWELLGELRSQPNYRSIPILVATMVENEKRALALGADAFQAKPVERGWLLATLDRLVKERPAEKLLVIDDDEISRYLLRGLLADTRFVLLEASNVHEGLLLAKDAQPRAIFLDLLLPGTDGFRILELLKGEPLTRDIPVIIHTSKRLTDADRQRLTAAVAIVPKEGQSRDAQLAAVRQALAEAGLSSSEEQARGT